MPERITYKQFYEAVGRAIAEWALVEEALRDLFSRLLICSITGRGIEITSPDALLVPGIIFYSSTNFRARLDLMEKIFRTLIKDDDLISEWNAVRNKANRLYAKRSTIAHGTIWGNETNGPVEISASFFEQPFKSAKSRLSYEQVRQAADSFEQFSARIGVLAVAANRYLTARGKGIG